ncbi:hypothetical protein MRX96_025771 [Rhipicephalus microplus]
MALARNMNSYSPVPLTLTLVDPTPRTYAHHSAVHRSPAALRPYGRLELPQVSLDHLQFPQAHRSGLMQAFEALLEFFSDTDLIACL